MWRGRTLRNDKDRQGRFSPVGQALLFVGIAVVGVPLIHYYLWRRMVRDTTRSRRARWIGTGILIGLVALLLGSFAGTGRFPERALTVISWPAYLWLAVLFYLLLGLAVLELPAWFARRWIKNRGITDDASRRLFLARTVA